MAGPQEIGRHLSRQTARFPQGIYYKAGQPVVKIPVDLAGRAYVSSKSNAHTSLETEIILDIETVWRGLRANYFISRRII